MGPLSDEKVPLGVVSRCASSALYFFKYFFIGWVMKKYLV